MGTSRRLLGIVLLLVFVGGGGYLLYREHERQQAERVTAATPAPDAAAGNAASAPSTPSDTASAAGETAVGETAVGETPGGGAVPADPAATAGAADASAADGAEKTAGETGAAGGTTTAGDAAGAPSSDPAPATAAAEGGTDGVSEPADTGAGAAEPGAVTADTTTAAAVPEQTISQPEPVGPAAPGAPSFDIVRVEPGGDAVMAGRSEPGMVIALFANGREIGRTRANESGEWVITLDRPLGPGEYVITVVGATPDGARQVESVDRIAVSIPEATSEAPMVALMSPDAPTRVLQQPDAPATAVAAASGTPAGTATASGTASSGTTASGTTNEGAPSAASTADGATDAAPPPAWAQPFAGEGGTAPGAPQAAPPSGQTAVPAITALAVGVVEKDGDRLTVSGASLPGATVRVYVNDAPLGDAVADAAGRWTFTGRHPVDAGDHTVRADQVDPATGAVIARAAVPFEVLSAAEIATAPATPENPGVDLPAATAAAPAGTAADDAPVAAKPAKPAAAGTRKIRIRKGDDLWTLAERYYGRRGGLRYTSIYRANRKQIRNPDLIYPGQVFVIPR